MQIGPDTLMTDWRRTKPFVRPVMLRDDWVFKAGQSFPFFDEEGNPPPLTLIVGETGSGKTNLLEDLASLWTGPLFDDGLPLLYYGQARYTGREAEESDDAVYIKPDTKMIDTVTYFKEADYAYNLKPIEGSVAHTQLSLIRQTLCGCPSFLGFTDIRGATAEEPCSQLVTNFVEVNTSTGRTGWIDLNFAGYVRKLTASMMVDIIYRLHSLQAEAVVCIDCVDLHLPPKEQRGIISLLRTTFPNVRFILTTNSPLVIQSAGTVTLLHVKKGDEGSTVTLSSVTTFEGWTVEEILEEFMGLDGKTRSDAYLALEKEFDKGLDLDSYPVAQNAYDKLSKIVHPLSHQRKCLRIQMSGLIPDEQEVQP